MPTFNEAGNIEELILRVTKVLKKDFEIIVVDDNSPDGTAKVVKELQKGKPFLRLVVRENERGLPSAIKRGIDEAKSEIVSWFDCDLSMPPEKLPEMITGLESNDLVIGSTFMKPGKDERRVGHAQFFSWLINQLARFVLGGEITDYTSGFIVAKKEAIDKTKFDGVHGAYFLDLICRARKNGYKIKEIPYTFSPRGYGKTKIAGLWPYLKAGVIYLALLFRSWFNSRFSSWFSC